MILPDLIIGLGVGYFLFFAVISIGMIRLSRSRPTDKRVKISILVACRNEEKDLPRCIEALVAQDYPTKLIEILLIDDNSHDRTADIIADYASKYPHIKLLSTQGAPGNHLQAKARVIAFGTRHAKGEWLFIVDADTRMHPSWLSHMLFDISEDIGLIGGLIMTEEEGYFSVSALEKVSLAYTQPITAGMSGWGLPAICSGPNMAIRRSIYETFGGLEKVNFNIAEDLALIHIVLDSGSKIKFHGSAETVGYLISVPALKHLFSQQRRWVRGGYEQGWQLWLGLTFVFMYHFVYSSILLLGWLAAPGATYMALLTKLVTDLVVLLVLKYKMKIPRLLRYWPLMVLYSTLAFIWIPISLLLSKKIHWQGEGYEVKY